ncbi:ABC transporter substrate-binding protein [Clostridium butyricum]|uniref:Polysaccharide ABC transporter substrate-binding protein n=1 Tax=Clostridium butyricum E4 str. BoNT E BL5262 TaxID=632245 RepID=C4IC22_CLOBU|nr:ABC transporter substrate-binding protein [Clostridium butyricum]EDT73798.1 polysaccharide ABC transporter substrate-binding protein [Clostridium butyricum 5521]EEP56420.1 polysaccharide ABC transporter substrate-binding protein [Clostridium butyricum E4 str. BoNT E BL5262]NFL30116.1 extracellular solute-binding protein [Clostridium butyricum]NFS16540.1 extracellular solute-binding protein [Clostridium butyricum]
MKKFKTVSLTLVTTIICNALIGCNINLNDKIHKLKDASPITLTLFISEDLGEAKFDDAVADKIKELTGVNLEIICADSSFSKPIDLMIAKEDYPDLIYAKGDTSKLIDARAIIKLDDYFEEKGENLKNLYGDQIKRLRYSLEDQSIYTVGASGVSSAQWNPNGTMQLQHRVLKELGYPKINTIYDYEEALKRYIEKYPETNGEKTIGLSLMASDWRWLITVGNIASSAAGIPDDGQFKIDDESQKATYKFQLPEVKEYIKWLNHLNAEGLLDPESFTQDDSTYRGKLDRGVVLGISDAKWGYESSMKNLINNGNEEATFAPLPVTINEIYKDQSLKDYGFSGGNGIGISKSCENKERAFEFLDWLASDEAQVLLNWGIEGVHYKIENGKRIFLPEIEKQKNTDNSFAFNTGVGKYSNYFPQRGDGALDSTGNYYTTNSIENYENAYNSAEKETLKAYGVNSWVDLFPEAEELGVSKHGQQWQYIIPTDSDMAIIQNRLDEYTQKSITEVILGPESQFDDSWNKIQEEMKKMGVEQLNDDMSKMTVEKIKLWNE